jgi:hypothetical protein
MAKYRKRPIVIEAQQYTGDEPVRGMRYIGGPCAFGEYVIDTLEGPLHVSMNDWIITGVKGEKYPCKPDIFAATYELVNDGE